MTETGKWRRPEMTARLLKFWLGWSSGAGALWLFGIVSSELALEQAVISGVVLIGVRFALRDFRQW